MLVTSWDLGGHVIALVTAEVNAQNIKLHIHSCSDIFLVFIRFFLFFGDQPRRQSTKSNTYYSLGCYFENSREKKKGGEGCRQ